MSEPLFFERPRGLTAGEIATLTGAVVRADVALDRRIEGVASLERAGPHDLTFFENARYQAQLERTQAALCFSSRRFSESVPARIDVLVVQAPYLAFVTVAQALFPGARRPSSLFEAQGVAAGAMVHATARIEAGVTIDPGAVVGPRAEIGGGTLIAAGAVIGPEVRIGRDCTIGAGATLVHALVGDRVIIHAGVRIGQDGFGYVPGPRGLAKVPQIGRVIIQDDVEIGANSTIDRGAIRDTVIGEGTKIDNLCQIAHNVTIGRHCALASQTGISGSTIVGDGVMMGGQVGLADHLTIGDGVHIGAQAGVMHDIPARERWIGSPAKPHKQAFREFVAIKRLRESSRGGSDATKSGQDDEA